MTPMLSLLILLPAVGGLLVVLLRRSPETARAVALVTAAVQFALTVILLASFDGKATAPQFVERAPWIPSLA